MKLFVFAMAFVTAAPAITGDLRPWRYSVAEHMKLCHGDTYKGNVLLLNGTSSTSMFYSVMHSTQSVDPPSLELQRKADAAKLCEKSQQDLLELLEK